MGCSAVCVTALQFYLSHWNVFSFPFYRYRVFAELLELGAHHNLAIPSYILTPSPLAQPSSQIQPPSQNMAQGATNIDVFGAVGGLTNGLGLGLNPSTALHHPGFYYLVSAECTERRREKFLTAVSEEVSSLGTS